MYFFFIILYHLPYFCALVFFEHFQVLRRVDWFWPDNPPPLSEIETSNMTNELLNSLTEYSGGDYHKLYILTWQYLDNFFVIYSNKLQRYNLVPPCMILDDTKQLLSETYRLYQIHFSNIPESITCTTKTLIARIINMAVLLRIHWQYLS